MEKIAILGSGNMGTALAVHLSRNNHIISIYSIEDQTVLNINEFRENKKYLPNIRLSDNISATKELEVACKDAKFILIAVPSFAVGGLIKQIIPYLHESSILINIAKGIDEKTSLFMTQLIENELPLEFKNNIVSLSGPSIANEIANGVLTCVDISSKNNSILEPTRQIFQHELFKVFINNDIIGMQLGGFFKNIIAIGAGICDGLGHNTNLKAALITKGFAELRKLARVLGADPHTLRGMSGLGDLIDTCFCADSRNRRFGEMLGKGMSTQDAKQAIGQVVEGISAIQIALELARAHNIRLELVEELEHAVFYGKNPNIMIHDFFNKVAANEFE